MKRDERLAADELAALLDRVPGDLHDARGAALDSRDAALAMQMAAAADACAAGNTFKNALEMRLIAAAAAKAESRHHSPFWGWFHEALPGGRGLRTMAVAAAAAVLCLALGLTLWASPAARAALDQIIRQMAGLTFQEVAAIPTPPPQVTPPQDPGQRWSLAEAQARLPFSLRLPDWAPQGFRLLDEVQVWPPGSRPGTRETDTWRVMLTWESKERGQQRQITLWETYAPAGMAGAGEIAGSGGIEGLSITGTPAAGLYGSWTEYMWVSTDVHPRPPWTTGPLSISWLGEGGKVVYRLETNADDAAQADLARMVSSMK